MISCFCFYFSWSSKELCGVLMEMRKAGRGAQVNGSSLEQINFVFSESLPMEILSRYWSRWVLSIL